MKPQMKYDNQDTPAAMVAENIRRNETLFGHFDPISGLGAPGERFAFDTGLKAFPRIWLPVEMRASQLVKEIERAGGIPAYCHARKMDVERELPLLAAALAVERFRHDFPYWAATVVKIKNKEGGPDIPFRLNPPQRKLVDCLESMRREGQPIRLVLLKARQWGGSTCVQIYMAWLQLIHSVGLNSLIIAHQGTASDEIKDMFDRLMLSYPDVLLETPPEGNEASGATEEDYTSPQIQPFLYPFPAPETGGKESGKGAGKKKMTAVGKSGSTFRVVARNCKIKVGTAERPDSCRGGDYSLVHLSEVGLWPATPGKKPRDIVRAACSGVLFRPLTLIVYESTANGTGNFFYNEYKAAARGESQFRALFVAWHEIAQYRLTLSEPEAFARRLLEGRHSTTASGSRSEPGSYLWHLWQCGATLEGIRWYEVERAKYADHNEMASEYPSDDVEAFVHSGCMVFDHDRVEVFRPGCRQPVATGEVDGADMSGGGALSGVRFNADSLGALKIWEWPDREGNARDRYLCVVDVGGRTSKADWSVICVFDRLPLLRGEGPEVVAQWRGHLDIDLLVWKAAAIASWYRDALLVFESNTIDSRLGGEGQEGDQSGYIFTALSDAYPNLYMRSAEPDAIAGGAPRRYGFHTNSRTKPMIITNMVRIVREHAYTEREEECLSEMLAYERKPNGSYGAIDGHHDDILMTRAIGLYISSFGMELPAPPAPIRIPSSRRNRRPRPDLMF